MLTKATHPKPCTVLLVEDNLADAKLALHSLEKAHEALFYVEHVELLDAAIARLALGGIDVALVDLSLPDSSGISTYQAIRAAAPSVPIVVMTGLDDEEIAIDLLHQGAQDYLLKNEVESKLLARSLRFAMERQRTAELELCIQQLAAARTLLEKKNARLSILYRTAQEFVNSVSHEFRTPLTVIKEYTSLVRDGIGGVVSVEQQNMLAIVEDRADDLNTMVDDMLDLSTLEAGLLTINRKDCQVAEIFALVRPALERKAAVKGVQIDFEIDPLSPDVFCDPEKAARVLVNLTTNAIKFCGRPGNVRVNCLLDSNQMEIKVSVSDNGNGISPENLRAIFQRFKQLGQSVRSSTKGLGLGLNIAKELAEANMGHLYVESEVGHGTTLSFTLPLADPSSVLRKFLKRQEDCIASSQVSLVQVDLNASVNTGISDDTHTLLSRLVFPSDLLLRIGPTRWLITLLIAEKEIGIFRERVDKAISAANQNRLGEPLPDMPLKVLGTWDVTRDQDEILKALADSLDPAEAVYA